MGAKGSNRRRHDRAAQADLDAAQLRRRQAVEINDNIVQGLVVAKYALDAGNQAHALEAVEQTLIAARTIITDLLSTTPAQELKLGPGDLIRLEPATVVLPRPT